MHLTENMQIVLRYSKIQYLGLHQTLYTIHNMHIATREMHYMCDTWYIHGNRYMAVIESEVLEMREGESIYRRCWGKLEN